VDEAWDGMGVFELVGLGGWTAWQIITWMYFMDGMGWMLARISRNDGWDA